jgi:TolB protein
MLMRRAGRLAILSAAVTGSIATARGVTGAQEPLDVARQITHSQNYDPSFSPDGKRMVFISLVAGREQLFTADLDGARSIQLTRDDADHEDPAWSPTGQKIAFVYKTNGREIIEVMNSDGSNIRDLTLPEIRAIHPNWSPDGASLAYCTDDDLHPPRKNAAEIYTINLATRRVVKLISGGVNTYPAWSPDGRKMAFRRMLGETNSEVFLADADGSNQRNITNHPAFDGWPSWSPDGKSIAFASNRNASTNYQIFVMKPDGSDVQLVANTEGRATAPQWTRDGKTIFFPLCRRIDAGFSCEILAASVEKPASR